nr:hypothetical protein [Paracoccaceae bacterium]
MVPACGLMRRITRIAAAAALALASAFPAAADTTSRIRFHQGAEGAEISGRIAGYDGASYLVGARAGQTLAVEM